MTPKTDGIMGLTVRIFASAIVLLITAPRLPAPIKEVPEPTPAAPAAKSTPKPKKQDHAKKPTPNKPTGNIIDVTVSQSTGSAILDQAAIATLRQWRATPNCPREVPMTITYTSSSQ